MRESASSLAALLHSREINEIYSHQVSGTAVALALIDFLSYPPVVASIGGNRGSKTHGSEVISAASGLSPPAAAAFKSG